MELQITTQVLLLGVVLGAALGAVSNKTSFCTMGAVSDWVNIGDMRRMRSWFLAIAIAIIGIALLESSALIDISGGRPPYRSSMFMWPRFILGGLMFGVGMTLASGCTNKLLVRAGGGNLKTIFTFATVGICAYIMTRTDFYGIVFYSWMAPISFDLATIGIPDQSLGTIFGSIAGVDNPTAFNLYLGIALAAAFLVIIMKSKDFLTSMDQLVSGISIGLLTVLAWYVTAGSMGQEWVEAAEFMEFPPPATGPQSFTFVNPMSETMVFYKEGVDLDLITFGMCTQFGVLSGSFLYAIFSRSFRFEWFASKSDFFRHVFGAALMGIGGILAMGCTLGQGITGVSTLAIGSFLALGSIILGSALTLKVEYYEMVYEEEASFLKALLSSLVDLHLLPERMRKLEAV
jgi:uncharacterized protein